MEKSNNDKRPQRMNMTVMRQLLSSKFEETESEFFFSKDLGISQGANFFKGIVESSGGQPFVVEDYRFGVVITGEIDVTVNLIRYHRAAGSIVFIGRGSIVQMHHVSDDLTVKGFVVSDEMMGNIFPDRKPEIVASRIMNFVAEYSCDDLRFLEDIVKVAWNLVHREEYPRSSLLAALSSVIYYYDHLYKKVVHPDQQTEENSRAREVFTSFIALVNREASRERTLSYYADKLCLSPRYLSTLIRQQSGQPAKYWIDQATIIQAKVLLRHTTKSVSQIADELHFPNDSFFCKYFRRLTGLSPTEYRNE